MCFRRDPFVPPSLDNSVPPKKRMSYRQPPYVPENKDLTEEYFPSDTEILCALREICSGPLWIEKNDIETNADTNFAKSGEAARDFRSTKRQVPSVNAV